MSVGHVLDRVDGDADAADLAAGERVIGVVAHLRRQIERHAQSAHTLLQQVAIPPVRLGGRAKPGVLPHRPQPPAVHGGLDAARKGELTRIADLGIVQVGWRMKGPRALARHG